MFKTPAYAHGSPGSGSDDYYSDISITSTIESNPAEDQTYLVEKILAEREIDGETKYLVKWEGYPVERCSWEPITCFANPGLALNWKKSWPESNFDWKKWENERAQEEVEREERKRKRARKREKLGIQVFALPEPIKRSQSPAERRTRSQRKTRQQQLKAMSKVRRAKRKAWSSSSDNSETSSLSPSSSSDIDEFIVDDDHISLESEDGSLPDDDDDSDGGPATRLRRTSLRRKSAAFIDEDLADSDSDNDKPLKATRGRRKSSLRSTTIALRARETEKTKPAPKDPKSRRTKSGSSVDTRESKSRSTLRKSSNMDTHKSATSQESTKLKSVVSATNSSKKVHSRSGSAISKRQLSPVTLQAPKGRIKRQKKSEPLAPPGQDQDARAARRSNMQKPQFFENLSTRERANKTRDRAPPASEAELFRPEEIIKRMSNTSMSELRPKSELKKPPSRTSSMSHSGHTRNSSMDMSIDTDTRGMEPPPPPTAKRPLPALKLPDFKKLKLSNNREGFQSAQPSPSTPMMSPSIMSPGTVMSGSPAATTPKIGSIFEIQSPKTTTILATDSTFEARVTFSDNRVDIGMTRFEGFSSGFAALLHQHFRENATLHISRSLETAYIVKYFVPEMGPPLDHAEMFVDLNLCDPFRSSLILFHGAGVLIHPQFTLLIFLSTNDILRKAFNLFQSNKKGPLRAVAYPPLEPELFTSNTGAPPLNDGFRHYHPNLYSRTMGLDLASYNTSVLSPSTVRTCIIYSPPLATLEQTELITLLKIHGVKYVLPYTDIPEFLHHSKRPETRILVHASFRDKLHLLPHVRELLRVSIGIPQFQWHFFGLSVEMARYPNLKPVVPSRFWSFGTVIVMTPRFMMGYLDALKSVVTYQTKKIPSTLICIPPWLVGRVERQMTTSTSPPSCANSILPLVYDLDKKARTPAHSSQGLDGGVIYLPTAPILPPKNENNELEVLADAFLMFQIQENKYRKYVICHAEDEKAEEGIYTTIMFYDPKATLKQLALPSKQDVMTSTSAATGKNSGGRGR